MIVLRWEAHHAHIALSAADARFGNIQVLYNNNPVQNLFTTTVRVENESTTDLSDLDLNLFYTDGSLIYTATAAVSGSANELELSQRFKDRREQLMKTTPNDPTLLALAPSLISRRDFMVPVLNRGGTVTATLLVQNPQGRLPFINVACDHRGVRLVFRGPRQLTFGVNQRTAAITGLVVGLLLIFLAFCFALIPLAVASYLVLALLVGAFGQLFGAALVRLGRAVLQLLD
jgi:hypothetical protein